MTHFWTEKEIESYLESQTRMLPRSDGSEQVMTGQKLMWDAVDFIIGTYTYTMRQLIELVEQNMERQQITFEDSFKRVVAYIHGHMR